LAGLFFYVANAVPKVITFERITNLLAYGVVSESLLAIGQFMSQSSIGGVLYFLGERSFTASTPGIANASLNGELVMRAYGTFSHPNILAGYLLICMVLIFVILFPVKNIRLRLLATSALLLGTIGLVLTLSRVAILLWIGFVIMIFVWQIVRKQFGKTKRNAGIALVVLFVIGVTFSQLLLPRFLQTALTDESVVQRQILIDAALTMINQNLWIGVGLGNFLPRLADIQTPLSLGLYLQPVHNIFLLVAAEIGIVGLGFFVWFLGNCFRRMITSLRLNKNVNRYLALMICLLMILVTGLFDHYWLTLQQGQLLFTIILALAW
jgi:O-antigen ligase